MNDVERYQRAGDYVLGLMDGAERVRAERDLEHDLEFRLAVSALTARIRAADREIAARLRRESGWDTIAEGLAALPQMQGLIDAAAHAQTSDGTPAATRSRPHRLALSATALVVVFAAGTALGFWAGQASTPTEPALATAGERAR